MLPNLEYRPGCGRGFACSIPTTAPAGLAPARSSAAPAVASWLRDVDEVLRSVSVAGLAWPDLALEGDLRRLADRSRTLGAVGGAARMTSLAGAVAQVRAATDAESRHAADLAAFTALQDLVGWTLLMQREVDLLSVQAALAARRPPTQPAKTAEGPVASLRVGLVGAELAGDRLALHGVDLDHGRPVRLEDRLVDVDPLDPTHRPVISRLFQARIRLADVLEGTVVLTDHPVSNGAGLSRFRPAFERAPVVRPSTGTEQPMPAPSL